MATINPLPKEILLNIFRQIGTAAQTGKCRLVRRKWSNPAEVIMIGCKIVLNSLDKAIQLYGHLCTDITKGRYIKHLHLKIEGHNLPLIYTHLLPLAFAPSMELLTGTVHARGVFITLMQIAHSSTTEFNKLSKLPDGLNGQGETIVIKAMIRFSFNSLFFTIGTFRNGLNGNAVNLLDKFRCLETLRLTGYIDDWKNLEYALKKCANLKTLALEEVAINDSIASKTSVDSWVRDNV